MGGGDLYEICPNPFDGSMSFIGSCGYSLDGLAFDGTTMYCCSGTTFGSIDLETASATIIGSMGNTGIMLGLGCDSVGNIFGIDMVEDNLYSINSTTGTATIIGSLGIVLDEFVQDMDYDKDNDILYLAGRVNNVSALYTINTSTGAATFVGPFLSGAKIEAFAIPYGEPVILNDVGIVSIPSPSSGMFLTAEEPVVVLINNFGSMAQSNFDVSFTVDGGTPVTETITATVNGGETYEYTFSATIDLSVIGEYDVEVCTGLAGDENPENNCMTKLVVNSGFDYCDASTVNSFELISYVTCGLINKASDWQGGVADYTDISTTIDPGMSEEISIINGYPQTDDAATAWVDWNNDTIFQLNSEEEFVLISDGTNEIFSGTIEVPEGTANGKYRMRVRLVRNEAPDPCGPALRGEIEDYTIVVDYDTNVDVNLLNKTHIYPNPVKGISTFSSEEITSFELYDLMGKLIINGNTNKVDMSNMNSGIYFVIGFDKNKHALYKGKIIKK